MEKVNKSHSGKSFNIFSSFKEKNIKKVFYLIGSPNVGKSTYFNRLTWKTSHVANIDSATTSISEARLKSYPEILVKDMPGLYGLNVTGEEEKIVLDSLINSDENFEIINLVSFNSIKRDLHLTLSLLETQLMSQIVVNMIDESKKQFFDSFKLLNLFKTPISFLSAKKNININESIKKMIEGHQVLSPFVLTYSKKIEEFIKLASALLPKHNVSNRFLIIQYLLDNCFILKYFSHLKILDEIDALKKKLQINKQEIDEFIEVRNDFVKKAISIFEMDETGIVQQSEKNNKLEKFSSKLDNLVLNKYLSWIFFLIVLGAIFYLTFGPYAGGWIQTMFAEEALGGLQNLIKDSMLSANAQLWAVSFVTEGLFGGIFTVLGFLPWIIFLTFLLAILDQIGYLARVSVSFDKTFERFGLSGRSIINLLIGVGCNIPSILMARNLNSKKERAIAILISPFIACSARVVVFGWIGNAILDQNLNWLFVLALVLISGIFSLCFGLFFSKTLFRSKQSFFMTEIPRWRTPDFRTVIKKVVYEIWGFVKRIILIVFLVTIIVWFLTYTGPIVGQVPLELTTDEAGEVIAITQEGMQSSWIYYISYYSSYLFYPSGIGTEWRLVASLVSAFPAKEIAASNLEILFNGAHDFKLYVDNTFNSAAIITSFIIFLSFYTPCLATTILIKKESGRKLMVTHLVFAFFITYFVSSFAFGFVTFFANISSFNFVNNNLAFIILFSINLFVLIFYLAINLYRYFLMSNLNQQKVGLNKFLKYFNWSFLIFFVIMTLTSSLLTVI